MTGTLSLEEIEDRLRVEFIDDSRDRLTVMYRAIDQAKAGTVSETQAIGQIRTEAHNLMGTGTAFGFPTVSLVAHRLGDYYNGLHQLGVRETADTLIFLDRIANLVDRAEQPALAETNRIIRALPIRYVFDVADVDVRDVEIMLVTPSKVVAKKVATEMAACGFRTVTVHDPIEAFGIAVRVPPDMVVASMVMDGINGSDLIRALQAVTALRKVPMAVLTSLGKEDPRVKDVPPGAGIIRLGSYFADDFAAVVTKFNLG